MRHRIGLDRHPVGAFLKAQPERNQIITTAVEHPATSTLCDTLEKDGVVVHRLGDKRRQGRGLDLDEYKRCLPRTAIVSVMANNETGTLFPGRGDGRDGGAFRRRDVLHSDAVVQAVGKVAIDLKKTRIDMLSLSAQAGNLQGRRRALPAAQYALPVAARRTSGTRPARRNREFGGYRRARRARATGRRAYDLENSEARRRLRDRAKPASCRRCRVPS